MRLDHGGGHVAPHGGSARAAEALGLRAVLVPYVAEHPDHDCFETLDANERLIRAGTARPAGGSRSAVGLEHMLYAERPPGPGRRP